MVANTWKQICRFLTFFDKITSRWQFLVCTKSDLEKAFDRVLRKVSEWAMRKRGIPEVMVIAVMSLYEGACGICGK